VDLQLLEKTLAERGEPRFRARQIWDWVARGAGSYAEMTNVPAELRDALEASVPL
jgi:23S rRNA (adenine2503-C2)-methyltransferase